MNLSEQNHKNLKKAQKEVYKLQQEVEKLHSDLYHLLKNLDNTTIQNSSFYVIIHGYLNDLTGALDKMVSKSYKYVNNQHKKLTYNQIKDLSEIDQVIRKFLDESASVFNLEICEYIDINKLYSDAEDIKVMIQEKIQKQAEVARYGESSPKNTVLYFMLLVETKGIVDAVGDLLRDFVNNQK